MVSSSSCPPTYRPCEAAAAVAPPPPSAAPSTWGRYQQRAPGSTAQANLRKIIAIITAVFPPLPDPNALQSQLVPPPPPVSLEIMGESESRVLSAPSEGHGGMRIDLRLRLGPPSEVGRRWISRDDAEEEDREAGLPSSACSAVGREGTTKLTEAGGGAALETAESGIVSASYDDGAHGSGMLGSNSPEEEEDEKSSEGEWDAAQVEAGGGRADEEEVKDEARASGGEEHEARPPCSEITTIRGNTGGRGAEESDDATEGGSFVRTEKAAAVVGEKKKKKKKKSREMDCSDNNETDTRRSCRRRDDEGYLGLLLEAVQQVSGGLFGDQSPRKQQQEKAPEERREGGRKSSGGGQCAAAAACDEYEVAVGVLQDEPLAPVVRSKRGRSQALPSRYRDSVLEPWRKYSGGGGHNRQLQRRQARSTAR